MVFIIVLIFVLPSIVGCIYYINKRKYVFLKAENSIRDGVGKYIVYTKKHKRYVHNINNESVLYSILLIGSSGRLQKLFDRLPEDNEFVLSFKNKDILVDSKNIQLDINSIFLTFVALPYITKQLFLRKPTKKEYLEYLKKYSVKENPIQRAYSYYEKNIFENKKYYIIASFKDGELDTSKKIILTDDDTSLKKSVLVTAAIIAIPAILILPILTKI